MTAFWAATDNMYKEARLRTKSLPSKFETYMDRDDLQVAFITKSKLEFEQRFSFKFGVKVNPARVNTFFSSESS